jgi:tryptophan-rich sensory protein
MQSQSLPLRIRRRAPRRVVLTSWIVLCVGIGLVTGLLVQSDAWYRALAKPAWTPHELVFPLVWLVLYALMGAAAARVTRSRNPEASIALSYFVVQLALNAAWLPAWFRTHAVPVAFVASTTLWLAAIATLWLFHQVDRRAAALYAPTAAWATLLLALTIEIWRLNPNP